MLFLLTVVLGIVFGVVFTLVAEWYLFSSRMHKQQMKPTAPVQIELPHELVEAAELGDQAPKALDETSLAVNFLVQYFFRENLSSGSLRRVLTQKINQELNDVLSKGGVRKFIKGLKIYDLDVGHQAPKIHKIRVPSVELHPVDRSIESIDLLLSLEYSGGFTMGIDAALAYGTSAFLSGKVGTVQGEARLRFSREPYSHWSFAFVHPPKVDLEIVSTVQGRSLSHVTQIVATQIRKLVERKHTLPSYRMRCKPFFPAPDELLYDTARKATPVRPGNLQVTLLELTRLNKQLIGDMLYCVLALDSNAWMDISTASNEGNVILELKINKISEQPVGMIFHSEGTLYGYEEILGMRPEVPEKAGEAAKHGVEVYSVAPGSPAHAAGVVEGDVLIEVNGSPVSTVDDVLRAVASAERLSVKLERNMTKPVQQGVVTSVPQEKPLAPVEAKPVPVATVKQAEIGLTRIPLEKQGPVTSVRQAEVVLTQAPPEKTAEPFAEPIQPGLIPGVTDTALPPSALDSNLPEHKEDMEVVAAEEVFSKPSIPQEETTTKSGSKELSKALGLEMKRTLNYPASAHETVLNETDELLISEGHLYLNICVYTIGSKYSQQAEPEAKVPSSGLGSIFKKKVEAKPAPKLADDPRDMLLGHISIPLSEIVADCELNTQGHHVASYKLSPPDSAGSAGRDDPLATQPGFDPRLCFGDILLSFVYEPSKDVAKLDAADLKMPAMTAPEVTSSEKILAQDVTKHAEAILKEKIPKRDHDFIFTHFPTAQVCDFCKRKIWLREALQCRACGTICHKKCEKKYQDLSTCTVSGFQSKPLLEDTIELKGADDSGISELIKDVEDVLPTDVAELKTYLEENVFLPTEEDETDELNAAVERILAQRQDESLVRVAKDSARELYSNLTIAERKEKIASMIIKLESAIEAETTKRQDLSQQAEAADSVEAKKRFEAEMGGCEEKRQALALLLLHYCSGLQFTEDLERALKMEAQKMTADVSSGETLVA